ncbi:MAG TPA: hypothetical protein VIM16_05535 [Mucilaginibacter sp.]|jgi:hypothetical protein
MSRKYLLLFSISLACFFSCGKDNTSPQGQIVGKWTLQQHVVLTIDNVRKTDTIFTASANTYATAQFNKDCTFSSASVYRPDNNSLIHGPGHRRAIPSANTVIREVFLPLFRALRGGSVLVLAQAARRPAFPLQSK